MKFSRLLSILDMYEIKAAAYFDAISILQNAISLVAYSPGQTQTSVMGPTGPSNAVQNLGRVSDVIALLDVPVTKLTIRDSKKEITESVNLKYIECAQLLLNVSGVLKRELESVRMFSLDARKADFYEPLEPLFGNAVDAAFPSSRFDIAESGKCYATDRHTACVMHLMRSLETPLTLMASDLGVTSDRAAWGELLNQMRPEIAKLSNSHPRQQFYSELAVQFRFFKNAWRDHAMHAREKYQPDEALTILNSCRALMQTVASELHE